MVSTVWRVVLLHQFVNPHIDHHMLTETVQKELENMEVEGIVEQSSNERGSPIVLVKKRTILSDCVDYLELNGLTQWMPIQCRESTI